MNIECNPLFFPVFTTKKHCRYVLYWGGRGRGASHSVTDYFLFRMTQPQYFMGVMLRATMAQIKKSLWKALQMRIKAAVDKGYIDMDDLKINLADHTVTYIPTGNSIICHGFRKTTKSASADLKGIEGCTDAVVEEAVDVREEDFKDLSSTLRTTAVENIHIFVLFNPPSKNHWLIKRNFDLVPSEEYPGWYDAVQKPDTEDELFAIHSTYHDNIVNINPANVREYENYGNPNHSSYDPDYYCREVLGLISEGKKGRIFIKVKKISRKLYDALPYREFGGLDWGFNAPNAVSGNKFHNGKLYSRQVVYEEELSDSDLAKQIKKGGLEDIKIYADPQEEKSIRALRKKGLTIVPSIKGPDSVEYGYRELKSVEWYITDDSKDFWLELEEHSWEVDEDGNPTDTPEDDNNHLIDATRYAYTMHVTRKGNGATSQRADDEDDITDGRSRNSRLLDSIGKEQESFVEDAADEGLEDFYAELYGEDFDYHKIER